MADSFPHNPPRPLIAGFTVFLLAAVVAASLIWRLERGDIEYLRESVALAATDRAHALQRGIEQSMSATQVLAALVREGGGSIAHFESIAAKLIPIYPGVSSLQLAPGGVVRNIVPLAGNEAAIGHDLLKDPARTAAAFRALDTRTLTLDGPFDLRQGGVGAVGRLPVFLNDGQGKPYFWGFTSVLISFPETIESAQLARLTQRRLAWALWRIDDATGKKMTIAASSPAALVAPVEKTLQVPNATWTLSVAPVDGWSDPPRLAVRIALGLIFSLLLAYVAKLLGEARAHERGLEAQVAQRTAEVLARETDLKQAQFMASVGSWKFDREKNEFRGSAELARIFGASEKAPLGYDAFLRQLHADDRETVDRAWRKALAGRAPYDLEYRIVVGSEIRWVHSHAQLAFDAAGNLRQALGTAQDITERKRREEELLRFRLAIDATADAIYLVDRESMRFLYVNDAACARLGRTREEIFALGPAHVLSLPQAELERIYDRTIAGGAALEPEEILRQREDGTQSWGEVQRRARRFGDSWTIVTVVRDISERKRSEQVSRAAEQQFRGLVEQSIAGIYIIQDGKFAYVNPRLAEILGYASADEMLGKDATLSVAEKDRAAVQKIMHVRSENETGRVSYEFTALRKDGTAVEVGAHGAPATHLGRPAIIGLMQDIAEKKRADEQIQHYVAQLETAFKSTVEVATTLSELRDPYTAGHERRVGSIAATIGAELGLDAHRQEGLRVAGFLHDIGKITIPAEILSKPGRLSAIQFQLIQGHPQSGYDVLKEVHFPWPVAEVTLQHHERIDGSGYPRGLKGEAILLEARILAVADVVEAMSSHRPYRPGLGLATTLAEIKQGRGVIYDAEVADACLRLFQEKGYAIPD